MYLALSARKPNESFLDADWAGDASHVFYEYVFMAENCVFPCCAKKHNVVLLSSIVAEFVEISVAATVAFYIRNLLSKLNCLHNETAQCLVKYPTCLSRSKHIATKYHNVKDMYVKGEIVVTYMSTGETMSDILPKNVCRIKHCKIARCIEFVFL